MQNTPIVQLSNLTSIQVMFTVIDGPIWRAKLWINSYEKHLSFMADDDPKYNKQSVVIDNIVIDFIPFLHVETEKALREINASWMLAPNDPLILFIHFENHNPPFSFLSLKTGKVIGFSYKEPIKLGEQKLYPILLDFPQVEDSSDNFTYKKMVFSSGEIVIDNSAGMLDDLIELFGNDITLCNYTHDDLEIIRQFFIESYRIGLDKVSFSIKDKRSRLTFKAPNTFYTKEEFPHIVPKDTPENADKQNSTALNKIIQDAYGFCLNVPGTCVNRYQLYSQEPNSFDPIGVFNDWFQFKFARTITKIDEIWVEKNNVWTQVYPGLGIPENITTANNPNNLEKWQPTNPKPIRIMTEDAYGNFTQSIPYDTYKNMSNRPKNNGIIEVWYTQAMKHNAGHLENRNGDADKIKMTGVFVDLHTPGDIIKDLMVYYGDLPYEASYFNLKNWEKEMSLLNSRIGICLDKQEDVYNWIEKIQNGALVGFQLLIYRNLFSARIDNPNREESFNIKWSEIKNREALMSEMDGEFYATSAKINYAKDNTEDKYSTIIDESKQTAILDIYKFEKKYENDTYLINEDDAIKKAAIILENFMQVHPIIRGIELDGLRWNDIELFSTGYIDLTVELPRNMKAVQIYMKKRRFDGKLRVKVIKCRRDLKLDKTFIDIIQCDYNMNMPLHLLPPPLDITGEYPNTINYEYEFDNGTPASKDSDYTYELDGGRIGE